MAHFKLIPTDSHLRSFEFDASSIATVLERTLRHHLGETDIYQDGPYKCTVRHCNGGVWTITQKKKASGHSGKTFRPTTACAMPQGDLNAMFSAQLEMA